MGWLKNLAHYERFFSIPEPVFYFECRAAVIPVVFGSFAAARSLLNPTDTTPPPDIASHQRSKCVQSRPLIGYNH